MFDFQRFEKNYREAHKIKCPHCEYEFEGEEIYPFVSMWGEDSETEAACPNCEKLFQVFEHVDRTWDIKMKGGGE